MVFYVLYASYTWGNINNKNKICPQRPTHGFRMHSITFFNTMIQDIFWKKTNLSTIFPNTMILCSSQNHVSMHFKSMSGSVIVLENVMEKIGSFLQTCFLWTWLWLQFTEGHHHHHCIFASSNWGIPLFITVWLSVSELSLSAHGPAWWIKRKDSKHNLMLSLTLLSSTTSSSPCLSPAVPLRACASVATASHLVGLYMSSGRHNWSMDDVIWETELLYVG
jgi:hypothetical protein